ncbi:hypothetical protein AMJ40_00250 [candidate division TA06 bacterium DG_26]|uniref:Uncharacterized protein n=1 Tax=candidate division TA06 bacterium DG_26 TaxID=1703771 RepID=A0A0S7WM72_UNCT6|nr:MAG: hypothetical protein AMJ40_00250 [candidate division TA06 bacterium DG_26]
MQRILAEIVRVEELCPQKVCDFTFIAYLLTVKVKGAACKGYVLPAGTKGKIHSTVRMYPSMSTPKKGEEIILSPTEVHALFSPLRIDPPILAHTGKDVRLRLVFHNPREREFRFAITSDGLAPTISGTVIRGQELIIPLPEDARSGLYSFIATCGRWNAKAVLPLVKPGRTYSYELDVNGDGLVERVMENEFLRLSLSHHFGARTQSVWLRHSHVDMLGRTFEYEGDEYVEYGGCSEHIGEFPGDLWKAKFTQHTMSDSSIVFSSTRKSLELERRVRLLPFLPVVDTTVRIKWKGRGEKDILYWHRMAMATETPSWTSTTCMYTPEKLETVRHTPPTTWRLEQKEYYSPACGAAVYLHEQGRRAFCFMTDRASLEFIGCTSAKGYHLLTPHFRRTRLGSGRRVGFRYVYVLGDDFILSPDCCIVLCTTPWMDGSRGIALVAKTEKTVERLHARLSTGESMTLLPKTLKGVGTLLHAYKEIRSREKIVVDLRLGTQVYSLCAKEA